MKEWKECTIADLGEVVGGATPSTRKPENYENGDIAWITPKDLSTFNGRFIFRGERNITEIGLNSCSTRLLPPNTVLFSSRAPIGYVAIAAKEMCTNQGFKSVIPNADTDYMFLYYLLKYNRDSIENMGSGTTFKEVSGNTMKSIKVRVPVDKEEQQRIGAILSAIDDRIEQNIAINENLEQQAQTLFKAWFVDFEPFGSVMPDDWKNVTIEDITSLVSRGIAPKYDEDSNQIVLNQKCIRNHAIDFTPARHHIPKAITEKWLMHGDLLLNSTGQGTLGRAAQVWFEAENMTVDSHITIVRPKKDLLKYYVGLWGITHETEIEALHTGSTGQTELPRDRVKSMSIMLPDDKTLRQFNDIIAPMTQKIVANQEEIVRLASIRDSLLPKLMNGEIDVTAVRI